MAEVLFWYPLLWACNLRGIGQTDPLLGKDYGTLFLHFPNAILSFSAVSTCDCLKGWCSPHLSSLVPREAVERKCCSWYRVAILASLFCIFSLLIRILIPQKFLINSVALQWQANIWSYQVRKAIWPGSSMDFSPLHTQLSSWALHQPQHCRMRMPRAGATQGSLFHPESHGLDVLSCWGFFFCRRSCNHLRGHLSHMLPAQCSHTWPSQGDEGLLRAMTR